MNDTLNYRRIDYTVKETAAAMRKALRQAFPGVTFSVRMARGTAYGWLDVSWTDGPVDGAVRPIVHGFQDSYFDGMDDGYHQIDSTMYAEPDGSIVEHRWSCCGANTSRHYSPEAKAWAESVAVPGSYWWPDGLDAWRDNAYYSTRELLAGTDLTDGFPSDPRAAFRESWNR